MSGQHTPEPWMLENGVIYRENEHGKWRLFTVAGIDPSFDQANARRIVACVNACAGIHTETLENVTTFGQIAIETRDEWHALKAEIERQRARIAELEAEIAAPILCSVHRFAAAKNVNGILVSALKEAREYIGNLPVKTEHVPGRGFKLMDNMGPAMRIIGTIDSALKAAEGK